MKTILKVLGILVLVLVIATFILPFVFKGKIIELANEEINNNINAKVSFTDISLDMFSHFPNFTLAIDGLQVIGKDEFSNDTLASIKQFSLVINLASVISGDNFEIKSIVVDQPRISIKVLENGKANYDIAMESSTEVEETTTEDAGAFNLTLKNFEIRNGKISYQDQSLQFGMILNQFNHSLSGDLSADFTSLKTKTSIGSVDMDYEGVRYISNAVANYTAQIDADLKNEIYTLKKNALTLNELLVGFNGSVSIIGEDYNLVLTFDTPKTDFKTLLSMVPAVYSKDFESIETSGKFGINGNIKGLYTETSLPAFEVNMTVDNGQFKYPDLPAAVSDISIKTNISSPGGDYDNTVIDISKFHMKLGSNPLDFSLKIKTPMSDPDINGKIKGKLDLGSVKDFYPLDAGDELNGMFIADVTLAGKLSSLENEQYEDFTALGSLLVKQLKYKTSQLDQEVSISTAQLNFSPQYLDLVSLKMKIGRNDFNAQGRLDNVLAWALNDEMLSGQLKTQSSYFNLNDLMPEDETDGVNENIPEADSTSLSVIEIPANIDFKLESNFKLLIYDNMEMENANGRILIRDKAVTLENLSMNILDGEMKINGSYATPQNESPTIDFDLDISKLDIQKAYNTFAIMKEYIPIAKKTEGSFSTKMTMQSKLDNEMMPVYETMTGGGELSATQIVIKDVNTLNKIADVMKWEDIKRMLIDKILFQFKFIDGKIKVEPFDLNTQNFNASLGGYTGFDKTIDYLMNLEIPRDKLGGSANSFIENITKQANAQGANFSLGETIPVDINIGGTLDNPSIKSAFGNSKGNMTNQVKEEVKKEIEKKKEEISKEARAKAQHILDEADKQSKKLIEEAEKQAKNVRKAGADAAKKVRDEGEKQAKSVEAEGKKKGFIAEAAAKQTAKQVRKEANGQADKLEQEADKQANDIIRKATNESNKMKQEAEKEADKLLKRN